MPSTRRLSLNFEIVAADAPPTSIELIPAGPRVVGRDGREWLFDDESARLVLQAFVERGLKLPIDREHATHLAAPEGREAPAAGWIEALAVEDGKLVGRSSWTPRGGRQVVDREYRYISPTFDYEPDSGRIVRLVSAALTNIPNLHLQALNREESPMKLSAAIAAALGLSSEATEEAGVAAIAKLKTDYAQALNAERVPSLDRYVPRADYDAVVQRATNAESALKTKADTDHKNAVDAAIDAALKAGKITPATVDYHRAACSDAAGLERFRSFAGAAPEVAKDSGLDERGVSKATALNSEQVEAARLLGMTHDQFRKAMESA